MDQQLEKVSADVLTGIVDRNDATDFLARTGLMVRIAQAAIEYRRCEKALSAVVFEPTIEVAYCQAVMAARAALYRLLDEEERIRAAAALDNAGDTTKGRV